MLSFIEWCIEEAKRENAIVYHGTSDAFLKSILSQGLNPNPSKKVWKDDPDASFSQPSRASLEGVYLTTNLLTATSSATQAKNKFSGEKIIVIASVEPKTLFADEDDVNYTVKRIPNAYLGFVDITSHEYSALDLYTSYLRLKHNDYTGYPEENVELYKKEDIENLKKFEDKYVDHVLYYFEKVKNLPSLHPGLINRLEKLVRDNFIVVLERAISYITFSLSYNRSTEIIDKYGLPNKQEAEKNYAKYLDSLTRTLKVIAANPPRGKDSIYGTWTARTTQPIGYSGRNKIIGIVRLPKDGYKVERIYGEIPEDFIKQYETKISSTAEWID